MTVRRQQCGESVLNPELFADRVVVVTCAGSALGRSIALNLAALGATLALVDRDEANLRLLVDKVSVIQRDIHAGMSVHIADLRHRAEAMNCVRAVSAAHGRIDGVFHCTDSKVMSKCAETADVAARACFLDAIQISTDFILQSMPNGEATIVIAMVSEGQLSYVAHALISRHTGFDTASGVADGLSARAFTQHPSGAPFWLPNALNFQIDSTSRIAEDRSLVNTITLLLSGAAVSSNGMVTHPYVDQAKAVDTLNELEPRKRNISDAKYTNVALDWFQTFR